MRDVLSYNKDELEELTTAELKLLLQETEYKESLFFTKQIALKTLMNALYGALSNRYFPLFNEEMAAGITGNGRYFIQKLANYIEEKLQEILPQDKKYIVYGDTDSVYFQIEPFMDKFIAKNPLSTIDEQVDWANTFEEQVIQPTIAKAISDFSTELNAFRPDVIGVDREIIADAAVFTAKKKYYARVRDNEGTRYPMDSPKIKVMGLEIIKGGTPPWSKKYLKEVIPHILDKDESDLRDWLHDIKTNFFTAPINSIAAIGGVSRLDYVLGTKGVPFGSRAALVHNQYIKDNNLEDHYQPIQAGDKCKRLFLVTPNKFNSEIIAYTNETFIKEIDCIDYDLCFEKYFLKALNLMVAPLSYDIEKETASLSDW